jgi:hypothetical protein
MNDGISELARTLLARVSEWIVRTLSYDTSHHAHLPVEVRRHLAEMLALQHSI